MRVSLFLIFIVTCLIVTPVFAAKQVTPIETVRVEPLQFNASTGLEIEPILAAGSDGYVFEYRWFLNGEENLFETLARFPGELLRRGDQLSVEVTPVSYQGERMAPFISLPLEAVNTSPTIVSTPPDIMTNDGFSYQVEATDLDGDPIRYSLDDSPEDMQIDSATGLLTWFFEEFPEGIFPVIVVVEDDFGGHAEQDFELNLSLIPKGKTE